MVYAVSAVYKSDFGLLINKHLTNGDQWGKKGHAVIEIQGFFFLFFFNRIRIFDRDLRRHCSKTLPTCAGLLSTGQ